MDNITKAEFGIFGKWLQELDENEHYIYFRGSIGMAISDEVHVDEEDVEWVGGLEGLNKILDSIINKAERLKIYDKTYGRILQVVNRVRTKHENRE